ncbi:hypothetical protein JCM14469_42430 [Desulfatiferula olefinivorans]
MKTRSITLILMFLSVCLTPVVLLADVNWESRATLTVPENGLMEARLLPGLHRQIADSRFDLTLTGPDGRPRAFELFMRDRYERKSVDLSPKTIRLTDSGAFVWEANGPAMTVSTLSVTASESRFVATVRAEGLTGGVWNVLADNEALYQSGSVSRARFNVPPGRYDTLRLTFAAVDGRFEKKALPIRRVIAESVEEESAYAEQNLSLPFDPVEIDDRVELKARLEGSGLFIRRLKLSSEAPFLGRFELGREEVRDGRLVFVGMISGTADTLTADGPRLGIDVNRRWPGQSLILRLYPQGAVIGARELSLTVHPPRVLFMADRPGDYHLSTGLSTPRNLNEFSRSDDTEHRTTLVPSQFETRPQNRVERLLAMHPAKGGPFQAKGYTFRSAVTVPERGYYRLTLHPTADLNNNRDALRIVREGVQVPFLFGSEADKTLSLPARPEYDAALNRTQWTLTLPARSVHWKSLKLSAEGLFTRNVSVLLKKPGISAWAPFRTLPWTNGGAGKATLTLPLGRSAAETDTFLIRIDHQDNPPLDLTAAEAVYGSVSLLFLATEAGEYQVYGGHPEAGAPSYDLALIKNDLLAAIPSALSMPDPLMLDSDPLMSTLTGLFQGKSWGLYIILGLVTLVLMGLVAKLFPKNMNSGGPDGGPNV